MPCFYRKNETHSCSRVASPCCAAKCTISGYFFNDQDQTEYLRLLKEQEERFGCAFLSYCLMSNHVHLLAIPEKTRQSCTSHWRSEPALHLHDQFA
ncbi:MAG: hypothetical protein DSY70_06460 [Desulfobulbus sp.]|nr:MAG: hypothetical protein DSY70_06460 [Desulfobulbus sp.]